MEAVCRYLDGDGPPVKAYDDFWMATQCGVFKVDRRPIILWVRDVVEEARRRRDNGIAG